MTNCKLLAQIRVHCINNPVSQNHTENGSCVDKSLASQARQNVFISLYMFKPDVTYCEYRASSRVTWLHA